MRAITWQAIARAAGLTFTLPFGAPTHADLRLVIDSRRATAGTVFAALPGVHTDGHAFAVDAARAGAALVIVARGRLGVEAREALRAAGAAMLEVEDVLAALQDLARTYRRLLRIPVLALTGSSGKTTTKEMLRHVLAAHLRVAATEGNHNNHLGLPLSLLNAPEEAQVGVFEIGISLPGEMAPLAAIAAPDHGMVVSVGAAHLEALGSIQNVAREKTDLLRALPAQGAAFVPAGDERVEAALQGVEARIVRVGEGPDADFRLQDWSADGADLQGQGERARLDMPNAGRHVVLDAAFAVAGACRLGVPLANACAALATFEGVEQRGRWVVLAGDTLLLDDSYNANALSMRAALELGAERARREGRRLVLVLGEMLEMGAAAEAVHHELGAVAAACDAAWLAFVGGQNQALLAGYGEAGGEAARVACFARSEEAAVAVKRAALPRDLIVLKGSRGVRMERIRLALEGEAA